MVNIYFGKKEKIQLSSKIFTLRNLYDKYSDLFKEELKINSYKKFKDEINEIEKVLREYEQEILESDNITEGSFIFEDIESNIISESVWKLIPRPEEEPGYSAHAYGVYMEITDLSDILKKIDVVKKEFYDYKSDDLYTDDVHMEEELDHSVGYIVKISEEDEDQKNLSTIKYIPKDIEFVNESEGEDEDEDEKEYDKDEDEEEYDEDGENKKKYQGEMLIKSEYDILLELEKIIGKPIPALSENKVESTFGFFTLNNHIISLGLYRKGLMSFPKIIGNLTSLEELDFQYNRITSFPEIITTMTWLKSLNFSGNIITFLPESIGNLKLLKKLDLRYNQLKTLPESIRNLKSLESLWLKENHFSFFPEIISTMIWLKSLSISCNKIRSLPESIGNLKSLKELYLYGNYLTSLSKNLQNWLYQLENNGCDIFR